MNVQNYHVPHYHNYKICNFNAPWESLAKRNFPRMCDGSKSYPLPSWEPSFPQREDFPRIGHCDYLIVSLSFHDICSFHPRKLGKPADLWEIRGRTRISNNKTCKGRHMELCSEIMSSWASVILWLAMSSWIAFFFKKFSCYCCWMVYGVHACDDLSKHELIFDKISLSRITFRRLIYNNRTLLVCDMKSSVGIFFVITNQLIL